MASGFMPSTEMSMTVGALAASLAASLAAPLDASLAATGPVQMSAKKTSGRRQYFILFLRERSISLEATEQSQKLLGRFVHVELPIIGCGRVRTVGYVFYAGKLRIFTPAPFCQGVRLHIEHRAIRLDLCGGKGITAATDGSRQVEHRIKAQAGGRLIVGSDAQRKAQASYIHIALDKFMTGHQRSRGMTAASRGTKVHDQGHVLAAMRVARERLGEGNRGVDLAHAAVP